MAEPVSNEVPNSPLKTSLQMVIENFGARGGMMLLVGPDGTLYFVGAAKDQLATMGLQHLKEVLAPKILEAQCLIQNMQPCSGCGAEGSIVLVQGMAPVPCVRCGGKKFLPRPTVKEILSAPEGAQPP